MGVLGATWCARVGVLGVWPDRCVECGRRAIAAAKVPDFIQKRDKAAEWCASERQHTRDLGPACVRRHSWVRCIEEAV